MTQKGIDLINKFVDDCCRELNTANTNREIEYGRDVVLIEHRLQLIKKYLRVKK